MPAVAASASFFKVLGVHPALGRFYTEAEDRRGAGAPVVVISERLWRGQFGGAGDILGRSILLGSRPLTIIGVAPRGFTGMDLSAVDAWLPLHTGSADLVGKDSEWMTSYGWQWLRVVARLKPGA